MSSELFAIEVFALGKRYEIYKSPRDRLKQFVFPLFNRAFGRVPKTYFKEFWALQNVSFEVKVGQCFGILGRNGAGKSTLLQILAGTLNSSEGSVKVSGRVAALLELGSGFDPEFSGRENIYINAAILGLSNQEVADRFDEIVAFSEIGEFLDQPVKTYSSGMLMRLAFSTAIHVDPDVLIVDEALAVGDYAFQHKCMLKIKNILSRGVTVLLVTHDVGAVMANCDRALMLKDGLVVVIGSADEVCNRYLETAAVSNSGLDIPAVAKTEFSPDESAFSVGQNLTPVDPSYRWGSGDVVIALWNIFDNQNQPTRTFRFGQKIKIVILIKANKQVASCFPGFMLSDRNGYHLTGITNRTCGKEIIKLEPGDQLLLEFETELLFRADNYSVLINIAMDEYGTGFFDLCENAGNFTILDESSAQPPWGYGRTYLPTSLTVTRVSN